MAGRRAGGQGLALFGLDDVLVDRRRAIRLWAEEFGAAHGLDDAGIAWLIHAEGRRQGSMERFFGEIRGQLGLPVPAMELWRRYRGRMLELATCPAPAAAALAALRRAGWRTGIVTNGPTEDQLGKIRITGLDELTDGWCISEEAGVRMPDPGIFRLAAARCGMLALDEGWMIGASLPLDIAGGQKAGLRTIWITDPQMAELAQREGLAIFTGHAPDFAAGSVAEAASILLGQ